MKRQLKRFGGIVLLSGAMLFFGCQTEELALEQQNYEQHKIDYKKVSFDQVQLKNSKILGFFDKALRKAKSSKLGHRGPNPDNSYTIDSTSVVFISYEDYSTYTFSVVPESGSNLLQNIVIADTPEGLYSYLSEYELKAPVEEVGQKDIGGFINDSFLYELENPYSDDNRAECFQLGHYEEQLLNHCQGETVTPSERPDCFDANGKPKMDQVFIVSFSVCGENNTGGDGVGNNSPLGPGSDYPGTGNPSNGSGNGAGTAPSTGNPNNGNPLDPNQNPGGPNPGTGGGKKPIITGPVYIPPTTNTLFTFEFYLSPAQKTWLNQHSVQQGLVYGFVTANHYSQSSLDFAYPAVDALMEGVEVDFAKRIIYTINKPCQKEVVKNMMAVSSSLTNLIKDTFNTSDNVNLKFWNGDISAQAPNANAYVNPTFTGTPDNFIIKIGFDNDFLNNGTNLAIVAVTLHEVVHAYFYSLYIQNKLVATNSNYNTLQNAFIAYYANASPQTFDPLDNELHNVMNNFMDKIANAIYNYAQSNHITGLTPAYCLSLAWGTMEGTDLFNQMLNPDQRAEANHTFMTEQNNTQYDTAFPIKGTPCP